MRYVGYSGDGEAALKAIGMGVFSTLQTSYNVVDQDARLQVLPAAREAGMGVIAKRPLANAAFKTEASRYSYADVYWERAKSMEVPEGAPADGVELALRFCLSHEASTPPSPARPASRTPRRTWRPSPEAICPRRSSPPSASSSTGPAETGHRRCRRGAVTRRIERTRAVFFLLCCIAAPASGQTPTPTPGEVVVKVVAAAETLLRELSEDQRDRLLFSFDDERQRRRWSNLPAANYARCAWGT